jgi:hypothetical protein
MTELAIAGAVMELLQDFGVELEALGWEQVVIFATLYVNGKNAPNWRFGLPRPKAH